MRFSNPWFLFLGILALVVGLSVLSRVAASDSPTAPRAVVDLSGALLRSANKWAAQSQQDNNALLAVMDSCYARAYAQAVRQLLDDGQTAHLHRVNMPDLQRRMEKAQQDALGRLGQIAPQLMPQGDFAVRTGWLG